MATKRRVCTKCGQWTSAEHSHAEWVEDMDSTCNDCATSQDMTDTMDKIFNGELEI